MEGVRLDFIKPRGKFEIKDSSRPYPLLLKLTFGQVSFIFGEGMAEDTVQTELLEIYRDRIVSSVIYLPGIYGTRATDFIYSVSPKIIVTSRYSSFLTRFQSAKNQEGMRVMPTDIHGNVTVLTDGSGIRVKTFR
jgi:beta-lactamase superfamily II metal-dependent hydrolase